VSSKDDRNRAALEKLLRDRLRKFMSLLPKVLAQDRNSVEAVHDLRVWSRRLQQVVATLSTSPFPPKTRTIIRVLRRARRALGKWRDCDVMIDLLERKVRRVRNPEEREAYSMIRDLALRKRDRAMRRACRKLAHRNLFTLAHRAQKFLQDLAQVDLAQADLAQGDRAQPHRAQGNIVQRAAQDNGQDAVSVMVSAAAAGYAVWREALSRACNGLEPVEVHAFRIRTKQLRYRIELARDLGDRNAEAALVFLKSLQDVLGDWHDNVELVRLTAEALANPEFLLQHTKLVALLLRKSDRERAVQSNRVRHLLADTNHNIQGSALDAWITRNRQELPADEPAEVAKPAEEPVAPRESGSASHGFALSEEGSSNGALIAVEAAEPVEATPLLAATPIEDFVKVINDLPR
jgi:CHAD domain-containing protein